MRLTPEHLSVPGTSAQHFTAHQPSTELLSAHHFSSNNSSTQHPSAQHLSAQHASSQSLTALILHPDSPSPKPLRLTPLDKTLLHSTFHDFTRQPPSPKPLWSRILKNPEVSTGPLARPFARSLAPLTHLLAPDCSLRSRPPLRSLVLSF